MYEVPYSESGCFNLLGKKVGKYTSSSILKGRHKNQNLTILRNPWKNSVKKLWNFFWSLDLLDFLVSHFSKLWKASIWKSFAGKSSSWVRVSLSSIVGDWKTFERHFWHGVISIAVYMGLSQIEHDRCWSCNFCHAQSLFPTLFYSFSNWGEFEKRSLWIWWIALKLIL